jgi:FtsZ-interacting cell division protein YlmF
VATPASQTRGKSKRTAHATTVSSTRDAPERKKEVPQRSSVEIDTEQLQRWRYNEEANSLEMELRDGQLTTLNLNAMSQEDVPRLLGIMKSLNIERGGFDPIFVRDSPLE